MAVLSLELPVVTVHGEACQVVVRVKACESVEFWYAEILHGVIPMVWLNAWVTALAPSAPGRFDGVVLSTGSHGRVLLSIPPEIIDHPMPTEDLHKLLGGPPEADPR